MASVRFMVMYDDELVDVSFSDGSRLQLAPCGSEYVLERAPPVHPQHERRRVLHRTRFTISEYRALLVDALNFRNKFATRPYLPEELIPGDQKEVFPSEVSEVEWPSVSCGVPRGSAGDVTVSSVDGLARLVLSGCGQEFRVEFLCRTSHDEERSLERSRPGNEEVSPSAAFRSSGGLQRRTHTCVVQHHSRLHPPPAWNYPLSLALGQWESEKAQCSDAIGQQGGAEKEGEPGPVPMPAVKSRLSPPLPLTCPCPHLHRWRYGNRASDWSEVSESTELVKVVWCHGVVYRVIGGAVPVVEVSPADGSVIRSNGALAEYYTHYRPAPSTVQALQSVYYLSGLPPDRPGQLYSVRAVVSRASRILQCYKQASSSRVLIMPQCCWRRVEEEECVSVISEVQVAGTGHFQALSDGSAHITFLGGVQVQMQWSTHTPAQFGAAGPRPPGTELDLCQITLPDGQQHLLQVNGGGAYDRYVSVAGQWCDWVRKSLLGTSRNTAGFIARPHLDQPIDSRSVLAELQKIRRFNFLLDNSSIQSSPRLTSDLSDTTVTSDSVSDALQKTTKAIQDINDLKALLAQNH